VDVTNVGAFERGRQRRADTRSEESSWKRRLYVANADAVELIPIAGRCRQLRLAIGRRRHDFDVEAGALESLAEPKDGGWRTAITDRGRKVRRDVDDARGQISKCSGC